MGTRLCLARAARPSSPSRSTKKALSRCRSVASAGRASFAAKTSGVARDNDFLLTRFTTKRNLVGFQWSGWWTGYIAAEEIVETVVTIAEDFTAVGVELYGAI